MHGFNDVRRTPILIFPVDGEGKFYFVNRDLSTKRKPYLSYRDSYGQTHIIRSIASASPA